MKIQMRQESLYFWAAIMFSSVLFFYYYPPIYAFRDEGVYMSAAYLLRKGALFLDGQNIPTSFGINVMGRHAPYYPLGNSILLAFFSLGGWKALFLLGWISYVAGALLFRRLAKIFAAENIPVLICYCFLPPVIFFSRTLMSDLPSLAIFLSACIFYFEPKYPKWAAGILFGINLFMRVSNVVLVLPFFLGMLHDAYRNKDAQKLISFLIGLTPLVLLLALYNQFFYGAPYLTGASDVFTGIKSFSAGYFLSNIKHYFLSLNIVYPGVLILAFFYSKLWKPEILGLGVLCFCFFSFYFYHDRFPEALATWVLGNRYMLPFLAFLIIGYGSMLHRLIGIMPAALRGLAYFLGFFLLAASTFLIHKEQNESLRIQLEQRDLIYQATEDNSAVIYAHEAGELVQSVWGERYYYYHRGAQTIYQVLKEHPQKSIYWIDRPGGICNASSKAPDIYDPPYVLEGGFEMKPVLCQQGVRVLKVISK